MSDRLRLWLIVPTTTGREDLFRRTLESIGESDLPPEVEPRLITVKDVQTIGAAWSEGVQRVLDTDERQALDYVWLGADDVLVGKESLKAAIATVDRGWLPAPFIYEHGRLLSAGTMGNGMVLPHNDGVFCQASQFPMLDLSMAQRIFPLPVMHYYADDLVGWRYRQKGGDIRSVPGYVLHHLEGTVMRDRMVRRSGHDRKLYLDEVAR